MRRGIGQVLRDVLSDEDGVEAYFMTPAFARQTGRGKAGADCGNRAGRCRRSSRRPRGLRAAPSGEGGGMSGIAAIGLRRAPSLFSAGYHRAGQEVAEFWIVYIVNLFLGGRS
jgi:hypothetical protein